MSSLRSVNVFRPMGRPYTPAMRAWNTTVDDLKPMLFRAKKEGLFFRNIHSGKILTHDQLGKALKKRNFMQGSCHWHLIDAQGRKVA